MKKTIYNILFWIHTDTSPFRRGSDRIRPGIYRRRDRIYRGRCNSEGRTGGIRGNCPLWGYGKNRRVFLLRYVFGDENVFRIHENSIAAVDFSKAEINLNAGSLSAVFNKIAGTGTGGKEAFKIRTPHTVAGVRGTVFFLKVENENSSYVCTCHGSVHYEDYKSGNEKNTEKYHHGAIRYFVDGRKIKTEEGKLLYHDDSSMEDVAETYFPEKSPGE